MSKNALAKAPTTQKAPKRKVMTQAGAHEEADEEAVADTAEAEAELADEEIDVEAMLDASHAAPSEGVSQLVLELSE